MKITIDDEKLQKLHWTHLKKLVEANGVHYDGFDSKDEAELYVIEQTEFTDAAVVLLKKYELVSATAPSDSADESVTEPEATSEAPPDAGSDEAPMLKTEAAAETAKADDKVDAPAVEDKADPEPETEDEADSDIPVFDHNRPHGKISGLCAARFYQDGHHFGGDYRFIPASEVE